MRLAPRASLLAVLLLVPAPAAAAPHDLELMSRANGPAGSPGDAGSFEPTISDDGSLIAFESEATNLGDPSGDPQIYVRDASSGSTELVSTTDPGGLPGSNSFGQTLSDSGEFICFHTTDSAIHGLGGGVTAVVVKELSTGNYTFKREAHLAEDELSPDELAADGDPYGRECDVSDDGRFVAFQSTAALDSDGDDVDGTDLDVYVRDDMLGTFELASRPTGSGLAGGSVGSPDYAVAPVISEDGRFVAYRSRTSNHTDEDDDEVSDVFRRDLENDETVWVSRADGEDGGPGTAAVFGALGRGSTDAAMSDDGRLVAFTSTQLGLDPAISTQNQTFQVYVRDIESGRTELVSRSTLPDGTPASSNNLSDDPKLSDDGRFVAFESSATQLDPESRDDLPGDIFVRDRASGRTMFVTRQGGLFGTPADGIAYLPALSGDGRFVAFTSAADNLSEIDGEGEDVFRRELDPSRPWPADLPGPPRIDLPPALPPLPAPGGAPAAQAPQLAFGLSEYAKVRAGVQLGRRGRLHGRNCIEETPTNRVLKACVLYSDLTTGDDTIALEGTNSGTIADLARAHALITGRYRLTLRATDFAGQVGSVESEFVVGSPDPLDRYGRALLRRRTLPIRRRGSVIGVPLRCPADEPPCRGRGVIRFGRRVIASGRFRIAAGQGRAVRLKVKRRLRRRVRARRRATARLTLTTTERVSELFVVRLRRPR